MDSMNIPSSFIKKFDNWEKKGIIIKPHFSKKWMNSHVAVPFAEKIAKNKFKVYFCIRDKKNRSHIVSSIFDDIKKNIIKKINSEIILNPGKLGEFDETGVTPTWVLNKNKKKLMFYVGWRPAGSVRLSLFASLAIKNKNSKKFKKIGNYPLLDRSKIDPYLTATLSILKDKSMYKMWYVSGEGWIKQKNNQTLPKYNIKYAESNDGVNWRRSGHICINFKSKSEYAIARPSVIKLKNFFFMWYCYKSLKQEYKIGMAVSKNGKNWKRFDRYCKSLNNCRNKWEKEMLAYPHVVKKDNELLMFYNGNGYGKSGIALAKLNLRM